MTTLVHIADANDATSIRHMHDDERPISGRQNRLDWLIAELSRRSREPGALAVTEKELIGWYLRYGSQLGLSREELQSSLNASSGHLDLAGALTNADIADGKPPPEYVLGQSMVG